MESPPHPGRQLTPKGLAWHESFAKALEARDTAGYLAFFQDDCVLQINNAIPIYSKRVIGAAHDAYLPMFRSLRVEILALLGDDRRSCCEAMLNYVCNDGSSEVVQCTYLIDRDEAGLIASVRVYGNASRVFKPFMPAND